MNFHKLLNKQVAKFLPEALQQHPELKHFLNAVSTSYKDFERDAMLVERAFTISEEEYAEINNKLKHEAIVKKQSIEKLKEVIGTITGNEKRNNSEDLLVIARYVSQQVNKRKKAEQIFTSLVRNMQSAVLLEDEFRNVVSTNQHFCHLFNLPQAPSDLQGKDSSHIAEESKMIFKDPRKFVADVDEILRNKQLVTGEILELTDGRFLQRDYIPISLDGKYKGHFWSYVDITAKKKVQDVIEKSELTNRLIMNSALDAIVIVNDRGIITFWNPQAEKIFGRTKAEATGNQIAEIIIPERFRAVYEKSMAHYHTTGEIPVLDKIIELTAINRYNVEFPVEFSIIPVKQETGMFFCAFIRDISERKKTEQALKASQELWQFALEGAGDGVWDYDYEKDEIFFSRQYKKMLGYEDYEFKNETQEWLSRVHPEDQHIIKKDDKDYLNNCINAHQREYRIKHKNGEYLWILDRGMVVDRTATGQPKRIIGTHTDITDRKRAEDEYRRISVVASANQNGVVFTDAMGKIFWSNEGFSKITGFSQEEIIGKTPLELCEGPLSKSDALQVMINAFFSGLSFDVELIHYRKDKTTFWGRVAGQAIINAEGKVNQYFAIIENISEEKEVERKLKQYDERLKLALTNVGDNYWEYDFTSGKTNFSNNVNELLGFEPDEYEDMGALWQERVHPDDKALLTENEKNYKLGLIEHHTNEYRVIHKDGKIRWVYDRGVVTERDENGKPLVTVGTHIDITERKLSEQTIRIREEKYRSIIANMNLGMLEVDNCEIIQFANQSFCNMSGLALNELLGKNASTLFAKWGNEDLLAEKNKMRRKGISDAYEISVKNKKGEVKWWLISGAPRYNDDGELLGSIGIHLDITKQKLLEQELLHAREQAESSANAKQTFLANMSHEIRTPMNAILGMTNQLAKTELSKEQRFYLSTVHSAADNLLIIINDILDLSKIDAGKLTLEKIGFEPKTVMRRVMQVMMHRAEEKGLNFTNSFCDSRLSPVLLGDPYRLNQVLLNLISNAIKFTDKGTVDVTCTVLADTPHQQTIEITVTDTGIGMEEAFAKNLFEKFSQEDSSVIRKYGGTGLGMSICKELVELMKGKINVKSKKGIGTSIYVVIDFEKGAVANLPSKETGVIDSRLLKGAKILVTDDNEINQLVAATILRNYGAEITKAYNGAEALEKISTMAFDIVLMDIQMPVMDGIEATKIIKSTSRNLPVIALTAFAIEGDNQKCIDAGMNDYLSKPFQESQLVNIVCKWLSKSA
ncbi:MAG: PAS domain S-box protein [Agriterribacter sp.]